MDDRSNVSPLATGALLTPAGAGLPAEGPRVPAKLGAYRVLGRLGEGGQGFVYRGHDDVLDRPVALKVLARVRSDELSDLEREARSVAAVAHPNVVQVYSAGEQDGLAWFAMELVRGPDLREVLEKEGPLPEARARRYLAQAARGLAAARRRNVFHRDVKPGNLLLAPEDDQVKVADFGLAQRGSVAASLTRSGLAGGTPLYVAPEVIREGTGDERADIYSLGATFFHLVAGTPPFGPGPADALVGHATLPAPDVRTRRPEVSPELAAILARCLAKAPADRYPDYEALQAAVETPVARAAVPVAPPAPGPQQDAVRPQPVAVSVKPHEGTPPGLEAPRPRHAPHPPRAGRFLVLACVGLVVLGFVRSVHARNVRIAAARAANAAAREDRERERERAQRAEMRARVERALGLGGKPRPPGPPAPGAGPPRPAASPRLEVFEPLPLSRIPPRARFPLSVEPAFSQVAWSIRTDGGNAFPDELTPSTVEKACSERADSAGVPLARACSTTRLPFAVVGPASSLHGLVAWHVHDAGKRTVLCVDQEGNERATTILQLLLWVHARSDEQGVPWETVVRRLRPFLPEDALDRELEQIAETW